MKDASGDPTGNMDLSKAFKFLNEMMTSPSKTASLV